MAEAATEKKATGSKLSGQNQGFRHPELKNTLLDNPEIKEVHFSKDGHHFNVYEYQGQLYARINEIKTVDNNGREKVTRIPILTTRIIETAKRSEILGTEDK